MNVGYLLGNRSEPIPKTHNLLLFQRVFMSLVSTSYFGSLAHTINFICNHIEDQSQNFINLPYNSDSALRFLNHVLSNAMVVSKDFQAFMPRLVFYILKGPSQHPPFSDAIKIIDIAR